LLWWWRAFSEFLHHGGTEKIVKCLDIFVAVLFLSSSALATDGSLSGTVKDPDGALFEKLPVVITSTSTRRKIEAETGKTGVFGPVSLPSGAYKVQIRTKCFKTYSTTVTVPEGEALRLDISLIRTCPRDMGEQ
jgi:Carboxypeptidase regulatory-like domain